MEVEVRAPGDFQKRIIFFVTDYLNRGWKVRDAVLEGIKQTNVSYGEGVEFKIDPLAVENLVVYFEKSVETYRGQQEATSGRAVAVGDNLYAEVVSDREYEERVSKR